MRLLIRERGTAGETVRDWATWPVATFVVDAWTCCCAPWAWLDTMLHTVREGLTCTVVMFVVRSPRCHGHGLLKQDRRRELALYEGAVRVVRPRNVFSGIFGSWFDMKLAEHYYSSHVPI